jgi:phosphate acetyltransferase
MSFPESARAFLDQLIERARRSKRRIVFPEGSDPRVQNAAARLAKQGIVQPILIARAAEPALAGVTYIDPAAAGR